MPKYPKHLLYSQNYCICDSNIDDVRLFKFSEVLAKVAKAFAEEETIVKIKLSFKYCHLSDVSITELVDFLAIRPEIAKVMNRLKLYDTKITEACFEDLARLLKLCLHLKIDISGNNIGVRKLRESSLDQERVLYRVD